MTISFVVLLTLFIYMPFHFFEEAMGNFPEWMYTHWTPKRLTYGQWMANNNFIFYFILVVSYIMYYFNQERLEVVGGGILFWGIINFADHFFYSIKDKKIAPGIVTGFLNFINGLYGFKILFVEKEYSIVELIISVIIGSIMFGVSCYLSKALAGGFEKRFGK